MASQLPVASMSPPPAAPERMMAALARGADRVLLKALKGLFMSGAEFIDLERAEAILARLEPYTDPALLADPARAFPVPSALPRFQQVRRRPLYAGRTPTRRTPVEVGVDEYLRYPTPYAPFRDEYAEEYASYPELGTVHLYGWRHLDPAPATLLLTHGWGVGPWWMHRHEYGVPFLFHQLGLDVYFYQAPFHGKRVPPQARASGQLHPSPDLVRTNEAFIQTATELRGVLSLILDRNPAPVGMMGSSLGGYTSALMASIDERLDFVIPVLPPASMAHLLWDHGGDLELRARALEAGLDRDRFHHLWSLHSPLSYAPKVPHGRRLIITGLGDTLVTAEHTRDLWEHWDRPRHFRFPGGHAWQLRRELYHREIGRFLGDIGLI